MKMSSYCWYKDDELEDKKGPEFEPLFFRDVLVVEPSRQDRMFSCTYPEMVERAWILTRPPPGLYIHEPTVTARQAEVARVNILGDTDVAVSTFKSSAYVCGTPRSSLSAKKSPPKRSPSAGLATRKSSVSSAAKKSQSKEEDKHESTSAKKISLVGNDDETKDTTN